MMASYKKMSEEQQVTIAALEKKIEEMTKLDGMVSEFSNADAREIFATFSERAQNRAELLLLVRALSKL